MPRRSHGLSVAVLAVLAALSYGNSLDNELVYGDKLIIANNALTTDLRNVPQLFVSDWWAGTDQELRDKRYRPLVTTSFALNYAAGGVGPFGYHLVNVFLHLGVCWLLYLLALDLGFTLGGGLAAASLYAVHPLHTEVIDQVSNRTEIMMALGVLASTWLFARGHRWLSLLAFGWAVLSKEQGIVTPVFLVLADATRGAVHWGRPSWRASLGDVVLRYGPHLALAVGYLAARTWLFDGLQPPAYPFLLNPLEHIHGLVWLSNVIQCAGHYLWIWLWPVTLRADYSFGTIPPAVSMWDPGVMWGILAWGGLIGLATWSFRRDRRVTFCVGITALAFLPVSNLLIPIGTPVAERLFYLPSAGLCLLVGLGLSRLAAVQGHSEGPRRIAPLRRAGLLYTVFALVCLTLVGRTMIRNLDWSTEERFYRAMVRDTPRSAKAHAYLGAFLVNSDRPEGWNEALQEYRTAMELYPDYMAVSNDLNSRLGLLYLKLGRLDEAISTLRQATLLEPQKGWSWYLLARAYALHGNSGDAEDTFRMSLAMRDDPAVRTAFSEFLIRQSRLTEGLMEAERALRARPDFAPALYNRALALDRLQCHREAVSAYRAVPLQKLPPSVGEELRRRLRTLLSDPGRLSGSAHQPAPGNEACALKLIVTQSADHSGP